VEYGSYFTDLSTEFSDIDILLVYDEEKDEKKYGVDLVKVLGEIKEKSNLKKLCVSSHLQNTNSPPVITITYDVSEELDLTRINLSLKYLGEKKNDLNKINIDITFTKDKERVENTKKTVRIIKESLKKYKLLKPVILYLKIFFRIQEMYSTYKGGINSLSLFCLARNILVAYERNHFDVNSFSIEEVLFYISEKFGH
jgi:DNA polymerase sigma